MLCGLAGEVQKYQDHKCAIIDDGINTYIQFCVCCVCVVCVVCCVFFVFQAEDGIRDLVRSRGLGDVYKRQRLNTLAFTESWPYLATG